jgi:hypothetical protein
MDINEQHYKLMTNATEINKWCNIITSCIENIKIKKLNDDEKKSLYDISYKLENIYSDFTDLNYNQYMKLFKEEKKIRQMKKKEIKNIETDDKEMNNKEIN